MTTSSVEKVIIQARIFDKEKGRYTMGSIGQVMKCLQMVILSCNYESIKFKKLFLLL